MGSEMCIRDSLIDDFKIESGDNSIHVLNAPSPGATSSLVIGKYIGNLAAKEFGYWSYSIKNESTINAEGIHSTKNIISPSNPFTAAPNNPVISMAVINIG